MPQFTVKVTEVRHVGVLYTVEAENAADAKVRAEYGETVSEEEIKFYGVYERLVDDQPKEVLAPAAPHP